MINKNNLENIEEEDMADIKLSIIDSVNLDDNNELIIIEENTITSNKNMYHDNKYGKCEVVVHTSREGANNPHFHIVTKERAKGCKGYIEICIRLDIAEYFNHKDNNVDFSNMDQIKYLNAWCALPNPKTSNTRTNWQYMCDKWNQLPGATQITATNQPNYLALH